MRNFLKIILVLIIALSYAGCSNSHEHSGQGVEPVAEIEEQEIPSANEEETKEDSPCVLKFKYFNLTVPEEWLGNFVSNENSGVYEDIIYRVRFSEKIDYERYECGHLFTILIVTDRNHFEPQGGVFAEITIDEKLYYLYKTGPTDVQFEPDTQEVYTMMYDSIPDVLKTVSSDKYQIKFYDEFYRIDY